MKVKPVILCGGSGTRLFPNLKKSPAKQFIDFGGWTLMEKTLDRINDPIFDSRRVHLGSLTSMRNKAISQ